MCTLRNGGCAACSPAFSRRRFVKRCGLALAAGCSLAPSTARCDGAKKPVRIAVVFLANIDIHEIWPYPRFDVAGRKRELLAMLGKGCPGVEFVPFDVANPADVSKAIAVKDDVDGYLLYCMTLAWQLGGPLERISRLGKPTLIVDEFLGGSGIFLTRFAGLLRRGVPVVGVSSTRPEDLVAVADCFADLKPETSAAEFCRQAGEVYRKTFPRVSAPQCLGDAPRLTDIGECVERFRRSKFLILGRGSPGRDEDFLGAKGTYLDFSVLQELYDKVDPEAAAEWASRWSKRALPLPDSNYVQPAQPTPEAIRKAGGIYLAMRELLKRHRTDTVTMNCLGGFAQGKLPAYPCLGFMQLLDDGGQGVCEAMPDDTLSMLMARILTGRPGFVSDPALDTSRNEILYAHCVGTTRPMGPAGEANDFYIRTLHNRDPKGACVESLLPAGFMTTSFRTNFARKTMVIHQAKSLGTRRTERGCRTKLVGEVRGDIGKLFTEWDRFGWHRVTVFGDVKEPLAEFGKALGLTVVEEA